MSEVALLLSVVGTVVAVGGLLIVFIRWALGNLEKLLVTKIDHVQHGVNKINGRVTKHDDRLDRHADNLHHHDTRLQNIEKSMDK